MGRDLADAWPAAARGVRARPTQPLGWSVSDGRLGGARGAAERDAADAAVPGGHLARLPARAGGGLGAERRRRSRRHSWPATRSVSTPRWSPPACSPRATPSAWSARRGELMAAATRRRRHGGGHRPGPRRPWPMPSPPSASPGRPGGRQRQRAGPGRHLRHAGRAASRPSAALRAAGRASRHPAAGVRAVPLAVDGGASAMRWPRPSTTVDWSDAGAAGGQQRHRRADDRRRPHPQPAGRAGALAGRVGRIGPAHGRGRRRHLRRMRARAAP